MEPNNFAAWVAQQRVLEATDIVAVDDLIVIGKKINRRRDGEQYQEFAMTVQEFLTLSGGAVSSVFGRVGNVVALPGDYNTSQVTENTNLYFTDARAIAAPLTGYLPGAGVVSAADTILQAIQKLDGNISVLPSGSGTLNYVPKWTPDGATLGNSQIFDNGTNVGIGTSSPTAKFHVLQNTISTGAKAFKVDINTWGEILNIDDNTYFNYRGLGANFTGDVNIISTGVYPTINFKYNNGVNTSGSLYGAGASMFLQTPLFGIGNSNFASSASLHVQGIDATSGNYALKVDNSASSPLLHVRNDGFIGIGTSNWVSGLNTHYFEALSPISAGLGTGKPVTSTFYSTNAYAQDLGGGIALGGKYNSGGAITAFGGINAVKLNSTDGDYQ